MATGTTTFSGNAFKFDISYEYTDTSFKITSVKSTALISGWGDWELQPSLFLYVVRGSNPVPKAYQSYDANGTTCKQFVTDNDGKWQLAYNGNNPGAYLPNTAGTSATWNASDFNNITLSLSGSSATVTIGAFIANTTGTLSNAAYGSSTLSFTIYSASSAYELAVTDVDTTSVTVRHSWTEGSISGGNYIERSIAIKDANNPLSTISSNLWVAGAGASGNGLYYSTDGKTWTQSNITSGRFWSMYNANGVWVAGGYNNGLYYSIGGMVWTQSNITSGNFECVYNANNIWVACSNGYGLYYSTDGKTWTQSNITSSSFSDVYYANGIWVACSNTTSVDALYYSEDGKIWTKTNINTDSFYCVYYANSLWVACNLNTGLYYSTDGKTWTQSNITQGTFYDIYYANGVWVACCDYLFYSTNGKTWYRSNSGNKWFRCVYSANGLWVAGGDIYEDKDYGLFYSTNGTSWTQSNITQGTFYDIYYANGVWVAGGYNNGLYYSTDGKTWTQSNITGISFRNIYFTSKNNLLAANVDIKFDVISGNTIKFTGLQSNKEYLITGVANDGTTKLTASLKRATIPSQPTGITITNNTNSLVVKGESANYTLNLNYKYILTKPDTTVETKTAPYNQAVTFSSLVSNANYNIQIIAYNSNTNIASTSKILSEWTKPLLTTNGLVLSLPSRYEHERINAAAILENSSSYDQYTFKLGANNYSDYRNANTITYMGVDGNTKYEISVMVKNTKSGLISDPVTKAITTWHNPLTYLGIGLNKRWFWYLDIWCSYNYSGTISKYEFSIGDEAYQNRGANNSYSKGSIIGGRSGNLDYNADYLCRVRVTDNHGRTYEASATFRTLDERPLYVNGQLREVRLIRPDGTVIYITPNLLTIIQQSNEWIKQSNITSGYFDCVYYANGIWVAAGDGLYYSTDGMTWTQSNITIYDFYCVYNANGIWVAGSSLDKGLYYSIDGKTWTKSNITRGYFNCVYYINGIWVAGSYGLYYSIDGKTWTKSNITSGYFDCVYYANGIWVAGSNSNKGLYYSTDGMTWTQSNITSGYFDCVYNANGIWVAGSYGNTSYKGLYYSIDGMTWTQSNITSGTFYCVYNANGIWVAGSNSSKGLYYSTDGMTWTQSNITSDNFYCLYYANGIWVAGSISYSGNGLYYSADGKTWTQSNITSGSFKCVYNANGIWVAGSWGNGLYYGIDPIIINMNQIINNDPRTSFS